MKKRLHHNVGLPSPSPTGSCAHRVECSCSWSRPSRRTASSCRVVRENLIYLPAEVCERMRRDGGSVFLGACANMVTRMA